MKEVLKISYTGDLLAHRRCPRAWAFEKYARFQPYEQSQAMEGRLIHHAMEWLTEKFDKTADVHATEDELKNQLHHYYRVLWARGIRTAFQSRETTIERIVKNLYPDNSMHPTVKIAIEGAKHTEYELRTVKKIIQAEFLGKSKLLLTGILDLVLQAKAPLKYTNVWVWKNKFDLVGQVQKVETCAQENDLEIWDYKGTRSDTFYKTDYVIQLLTYAGLYYERTGSLPARCVLFFINEEEASEQLVAIPIDKEVVKVAENWTIEEARFLRKTMKIFEKNPLDVSGGGFNLKDKPKGSRINSELKKQCTACGLRFDCEEYNSYLGDGHSDVDMRNVGKN